jgi:hypothetical protein
MFRPVLPNGCFVSIFLTVISVVFLFALIFHAAGWISQRVALLWSIEASAWVEL